MGSCKRCKSLSLSLRKYLQIFSQSCSVDRTFVKIRILKGPLYVKLKMRNENLKTIGSIGSCISCVLSPVWSTTCDSGFQTMKAATGSTNAMDQSQNGAQPLWNWVKFTRRPVSSENRSTWYGKFPIKERCKIIYIRQSSVPSSSASIWRNDGQHTSKANISGEEMELWWKPHGRATIYPGPRPAVASIYLTYILFGLSYISKYPPIASIFLPCIYDQTTHKKHGKL